MSVPNSDQFERWILVLGGMSTDWLHLIRAAVDNDLKKIQEPAQRVFGECLLHAIDSILEGRKLALLFTPAGSVH